MEHSCCSCESECNELPEMLKNWNGLLVCESSHIYAAVERDPEYRRQYAVSRSMAAYVQCSVQHMHAGCPIMGRATTKYQDTKWLPTRKVRNTQNQNQNLHRNTHGERTRWHEEYCDFFTAL